MSSVSVIITCYNQADTICELLEMQCKQTREADEIIILDDASSDNSFEIIQSFISNRKNFKVYRNKRNLGVIHNVNQGILLATKEYLHLPSDNIVFSEFYEKSLAVLAQYPRAAFSFSDLYTYSEGIFRHECYPKLKKYFTKEDFIHLAKQKKFISASVWTMLIRREYMRPLNPLLRWHSDFFIITTLGLRHGICYVPGRLCAYRRDVNSYSRQKGSQYQRRGIYQEMFRLLKTDAYQDVRSHFKKGHFLDHFGIPVFLAILSRPQNMDFLSLKLLNYALRASCIKPIESFFKTCKKPP